MSNQKLLGVKFGHIAAEEEAVALRNYFVETSEYSELLSDPDKILVVGRKGSGKSAIYLAVKNLSFFQKGVARPLIIDPQRDASIALVQILTEFFNLRELNSLAYSLGVNYDELEGDTLSAKALSLVRFLERRNRLDALINRIQEARPNISFQTDLENLKKPVSTISWTNQETLMLIELIENYFTISDIKTTSFDLGINFEEISYSNKKEMAYELVNYMRRRNRLNELLETLKHYNPTAHWDRIFATSYKPTVSEIERRDSNSENDLWINKEKDIVVEAMTLNDYPWELHKMIRDSGVPLEQAYVNSWTYIIWILLAKKVISFGEPSKFKVYDKIFWRRLTNSNLRFLHRYLEQNYGSLAPSFKEILADRTRQVRSLKIKDFEIGTESEENPFQQLSRTISYINRIIQAHVLSVLSKQKEYYLLFDQLDLGWDDTEETKQLLIGLILAARNIRRAAKELYFPLNLLT